VVDVTGVNNNINMINAGNNSFTLDPAAVIISLAKHKLIIFMSKLKALPPAAHFSRIIVL
jgi:hypothetical protein